MTKEPWDGLGELRAMAEAREEWFLDHSSGCYFCGGLFLDRDMVNADEWNGGDGGSICQECQLSDTPVSKS